MFSLIVECALFLLKIAMGVSFVTATAHGIVDSITSLVAKRRLKRLLRSHNDPELSRLALLSRDLSDEEVARAVQSIRSTLDGLGSVGRRNVERGLLQNNRAGQRSYVYELIDALLPVKVVEG